MTFVNPVEVGHRADNRAPEEYGLPYRRQSSTVTQQFLGGTEILLGTCATTRQPQYWYYWESGRRRNCTKISLPSTTPHVGKKSSGWSKFKVTGIRVGKRMAAHKVIFPVLKRKDRCHHLTLVGGINRFSRIKLSGGANQ